MKRSIIVLSLVGSLAFAACQSKPEVNCKLCAGAATTETANATPSANIPYILAKNYFVNNSVSSLDIPKIETAEEFQEIFGAATTMGANGTPTNIDFTTQYVITVVLPETNLTTNIEPISLKKDDNGITFSYKVSMGEKQSYTTRPNLIIVVDKANDGNVILKEVK
ncbi:MAG: hypothetical protein ACK5MI_01680 [Mangrovibacterium sp.]